MTWTVEFHRDASFHQAVPVLGSTDYFSGITLENAFYWSNLKNWSSDGYGRVRAPSGWFPLSGSRKKWPVGGRKKGLVVVYSELHVEEYHTTTCSNSSTSHMSEKASHRRINLVWVHSYTTKAYRVNTSTCNMPLISYQGGRSGDFRLFSQTSCGEGSEEPFISQIKTHENSIICRLRGNTEEDTRSVKATHSTKCS